LKRGKLRKAFRTRTWEKRGFPGRGTYFISKWDVNRVAWGNPTMDSTEKERAGVSVPWN